jgi:hypothetical protein
MTHAGVKCAFCAASPVVGHRLKCISCADFDLCAECYARTSPVVHPQHAFDERKRSNGMWFPASQRDTALSVPAVTGGSVTGGRTAVSRSVLVHVTVTVTAG